MSSEGVKEFKVNDYITLKLEDGITFIYIKGERFDQCKFLLLNIPIDNFTSFDNIESIDEAADKLDLSVEFKLKKFNLPPKVEFWGHCSNLQVWYENDYDTRLLHSNLAFPILKKLTEMGDVLAKRVFKNEIAKRFENGFTPVRNFLIEEGYLDFLSDDEIEIFSELQSINYKDKRYSFTSDLKLTDLGIIDISEIIGINKISNLRSLDLSHNQIKVIKGLENLIQLEFLDLSHNQITEIKGLDSLENLTNLYLSSNKIKQIKGLSKLTNLEWLLLSKNKISEIKGLNSLKNLLVLDLNENEITEIKGLDNLIHLEGLTLHKNKIKKIKGLGNLQNLGKFVISDNPISKSVIDELNNLEGYSLGQKAVEYCRIKNLQ
ncbi:MAG: leucine-rich repeat domain-containing protein [Candidatus Hodarchaeales archaeon]